MPLRRLALLLAALPTLVLASAAPATGAPERVSDLVERYVSRLHDRSVEGYKAQREALEALADLGTPEARGELERLLKAYGRADRRGAVELLGALIRHGSPRDVDTVVRWVERDSVLVELLPKIFARIVNPISQRYLRGDLLHKALPPVKAQIARTLGAGGDPASALPLMRLLREQTERVRVEALLALGHLGDVRARVPIESFLRNENLKLRASAAQALGLMKSKASVPALIRALDDEQALVVELAAEALGRIDDPKAVQPLIDGLKRTHESNLRLADTFTTALRLISGKGIAPDPELWQAWWNVAKDRPLVKTKHDGPANSVPGARYYGFPVRSSRVIFVLDISRSMGWNQRLEKAQDELTRTLAELPKTTRFNIIVYSDRAVRWRKKLTPAKSGPLKSAKAFVRKQRPDNGTNTHEALLAAFADQEADTIFLLSDGHPSVGAVVDPELIRLAVKDLNRFRRMRVHCIALMRGEPPAAFAGREDPASATRFLKALAEDNLGWFRDVR